MRKIMNKNKKNKPRNFVIKQVVENHLGSTIIHKDKKNENELNRNRKHKKSFEENEY